MPRYVVCYDISNDRRRRNVASILEGFGDRVQESVFELNIEISMMDKCRNILQKVMDLEADGLTIYPLCGTCNSKREYYGISSSKSEIGEEVVFIV